MPNRSFEPELHYKEGRPYSPRHLCVVLGLLAVPLLQSLRYLGDAGGMGYGYSHLFINYVNGFTKRGLYGELFLFIPYISLDLARIIGFCSVAAAVALSYCAVVRKPLVSVQGALVLAFLLSGCGVLPHLAFISGFLDVPLFIVAALNIIVISICGNVVVRAALTIFLTCIGMLIHEAYVVLFYPTIVMIVLSQQRSTQQFNLLFWMQQGAIGSGLLLVVVLGRSHFNPEEAFRIATERTNISIMPQAFNVLTRDFSQQWAYLSREYNGRDNHKCRLCSSRSCIGGASCVDPDMQSQFATRGMCVRPKQFRCNE